RESAGRRSDPRPMPTARRPAQTPTEEPSCRSSPPGGYATMGVGGWPSDGSTSEKRVVKTSIAPMRRLVIPRSRLRGIGLRWLAVIALGAAACTSSPVGVVHIDPSDVHRALTDSALSVRKLSTFSESVLLEANLADLYESDPEKALERLHDLAVSASGG